MTLDELEGLCARLERELADAKHDAWLVDGVAGTCYDDPRSSQEWRDRQRRRISELRARIVAWHNGDVAKVDSESTVQLTKGEEVVPKAFAQYLGKATVTIEGEAPAQWDAWIEWRGPPPKLDLIVKDSIIVGLKIVG